MQRVLVVGISGAGKTTYARSVAELLHLPPVEFDGLAHGPGWSTPPDLARTVAALAAQERWVVDSWGYPADVRGPLWQRADTVLWLDLPRRTTMPRVLRRSLRRTLTRQRIFGGNRETLRGWLDPDHPVRSSWREHASRRAQLLALVGAHRAQVRRFRTAAEAARWLAVLAVGPGAGPTRTGPTPSAE